MRQSNPQEFERRKKEIFGKDAMNQNAELAGIDKLNARTAARDVASSRLDALLGAGVIARAQFALRKVGNETKLGSLMIGAKGDTGGSMGTNRRFNVQGGQTDINDPNLQRLLSRLQLLDNLSYQIDRNKGNFYIETDNQGNVTGITGIDNDASFGTKTNVSAQVSDYPGIAKFIDRELAQRIKTLDIELLELAMTDLLTPEEIDALFKRLTILQSAIAQMDDNQLLTPEQWDQAVGLNMLEEKRKWHSGKGSYHGALSKDVHD